MKVTGYISPSVKLGLAIPGQQRPHPYFHRPLQMLLGAGFAAGFAMDGLEERAFPADHPAGRNPLGWGANYAEIPPVMVVRMRLR
ncbi:MAG TPA: hypothetical protein PL105_22660, partial [Caldilineaceae bacterium]|nr:hypothetical protein [Caldilineaceae bacterium]